MNNWVGFLSNNFQWQKNNHLNLQGEGVFEYNPNTKIFQMEGIFDVNEIFREIVWRVTFKVSDIVHWQNMEHLIFSRNIQVESIEWLNGGKHNIFNQQFNYIWLLKSKTNLTPEEERYLRDYQIMSSSSKKENEWRYNSIKVKIDKSITDEREKILWILNEHRWVNTLEMF